MKFRLIIILTLVLITGNYLTASYTGKKIIISGTVTDGNNKPVPNVFITIDGKITNTVTDEKGFYRIRVSPGSQKIGFSTIWVQGAEELIDGRTSINHTLSIPVPANKKTTPETNKPVDPSTSLNDKISTNKNYIIYNNIYELLQGEFPTLIIKGKTILVPGSVSMKLSTEPLLIVDGIEANSIDNIIPAMVKSVQLLKGSSASIYGMKGANGVILINLMGTTNNNIKK